MRLFWQPKRLAYREVHTPSLAVTLPAGAALGLLAGLTGTGGGIFLSPLIILFGWETPRHTSGVAAGFILLNSIAGLRGNLAAVRGLAAPSCRSSLGAVAAGALLGTWLGVERLPRERLLQALGLVLTVAGYKLIFAMRIVILAGGEGRRIGGGKPQRLLGGETPARPRAAASRAAGRTRCWSRTAGSDAPGIEGPLGGIAAALALGGDVLTIPCDMPFLPADLPERLGRTSEAAALGGKRRAAPSGLRALARPRCGRPRRLCRDGPALADAASPRRWAMKPSPGPRTRSIPSSTSTTRTIWRGPRRCSKVDDLHQLARTGSRRAGGAADEKIGGGEGALRAGILVGEQAHRIAGSDSHGRRSRDCRSRRYRASAWPDASATPARGR